MSRKTPASGGPKFGLRATDSDIQELLQEFLKALQATLDKSSTSYSSDGRTSSVSAALLIDYQS